MASNFKQVNDRLIAGDGDPSDGDGLSTNLSLFPINTIYINNSTGKVFARDAANGVAADWVSQEAGGTGGIDDVLAVGQALVDNRTIQLNEKTLYIVQSIGGGDLTTYFSVDPSPGYETSTLRAYNIASDSDARFKAQVDDSLTAHSQMEADFGNGVKVGRLEVLATSTASSATYTADKHIFNGVAEHADNAAAVTAGLAVGTMYRTGDLLKIVH